MPSLSAPSGIIFSIKSFFDDSLIKKYKVDDTVSYRVNYSFGTSIFVECKCVGKIISHDNNVYNLDRVCVLEKRMFNTHTNRWVRSDIMEDIKGKDIIYVDCICDKVELPLEIF